MRKDSVLHMCKHSLGEKYRVGLFTKLVSIEDVDVGFFPPHYRLGCRSTRLCRRLRQRGTGGAMISSAFYLRLVSCVTVLTLLALSDVGSEKALEKILKRVDRNVNTGANVAVTPSKAKQFLASLKRPKRNLWDRSRPDVQQWIQQFMYMGFDEARLETDLAYWMDQQRSTDQGRQHHYDENSPMGPRNAWSYRHGANVNYDYY